jgi:hypothetical protein
MLARVELLQVGFFTLDPLSFWYSFNFLTGQHSWLMAVSAVEGAFVCVCPSFV